MKTTSLLIASLVTVLCVAGCTRFHYIETETPSGQVPPPPVSVTAAAPAQQSSPALAVANQQRPDFVSEGAVIKAEAGSEQRETDLASGTMTRFKTAYDTKNKPRIAVFLNRQLSDEVREWITDSRLVVAGGFTENQTVDGKPAEKKNVTGEIAVHSQQQADNGVRLNPSERWMWAFEDGFIQPFLKTGTKIVDRATIVRLAAAESVQQDSAFTSISAKKIEMDALKGYADIFVEILISRSPSALYGYEFKASAKEVATGLIIANVTSLRWRPEDRRQRIVLATSEGYEVLDAVKIPPVADIASNLSLELIGALADVLEQ